MPHSIGFACPFVIGAEVEVASPPVGGDDSTHPPMTIRALGPTVCAVQFRDQTPPSAEGPPAALRALGSGVDGRGADLDVRDRPQARPARRRPRRDRRASPRSRLGLLLSVRRHEWFDGARFIGLALVGAASILFAAIQPDSAGYAGVYFVMALGGIRLGRDAAIVVCGGTVVGIVVVGVAAHENPAFIAGLLFSVAPVVPCDAADPAAGGAARRSRAADRGTARVARGGGRGGQARRARPRGARVARRARALVERALAPARGHAAAGPQDRRRRRR